MLGDKFMINATTNGNIYAMKDAIRMDASGRLVLPKEVRERLNLSGGALLRAEVVAGHVELVPVAADGAGLVLRKGGIAVLKRTGAVTDAAAAVSADRAAQEGRGLRR
jgi:AbrB family looped-hinge helix DNA binding protein